MELGSRKISVGGHGLISGGVNGMNMRGKLWQEGSFPGRAFLCGDHSASLCLHRVSPAAATVGKHEHLFAWRLYLTLDQCKQLCVCVCVC